jgi:hypothetical protein
MDAPPQDTQTGFWFVHEPNYKYAIAGVPIVVGVLLFLAFFVSPWYAPSLDKAKDVSEDKLDNSDKFIEEQAELFDSSEDDARDNLIDGSGIFIGERDTITAWQVWTGADGAVLKVDENIIFVDENGFGEVAMRDRLLILIPLLALGLVGIGGMYIADRLDQRTSLIAVVVLAFLLFLVPLLWQGLTTSYFKGAISDGVKDSEFSKDATDQASDWIAAILTSPYSTFEFVFLSFIALLFSAGSYLILQSEHKRLGTNWPPPINPFPSSGSAGTAPPPVAPPAPPPSA